VNLIESSNENADFTRRTTIVGGMVMFVDSTTSFATEFMEKKMPVYTIYSDMSDEYETQGGVVDTELLDGDFKKVIPVGIDFHPSAQAALMGDGTIIYEKSAYQGVPVDLSHLPTKVQWGGGKRELSDILKTFSKFLVSKKLRDVIEKLEPQVHQFAPLELIWMQDNSHAGDYFWFYPCNRIDSLDRELTTYDFDEDIGLWKHVDGKKPVVNLLQVGDAHIWIDPRWNTFGNLCVSEAFKQAMDAAGVTGIGYNETEVV